MCVWKRLMFTFAASLSLWWSNPAWGYDDSSQELSFEVLDPSFSLTYAGYFDFPACYQQKIRVDNRNDGRAYATSRGEWWGCPSIESRPKNCSGGIFRSTKFRDDGYCPLYMFSTSHWEPQLFDQHPGFFYRRRDGDWTEHILHNRSRTYTGQFPKKELALALLDSHRAFIPKDRAGSRYSPADFSQLVVSLDAKVTHGLSKPVKRQAKTQITLMYRFTKNRQKAAHIRQHSIVVHIEDKNPRSVEERLRRFGRKDLLYAKECDDNPNLKQECHVNVDATFLKHAVQVSDLGNGWKNYRVNFTRLINRFRESGHLLVPRGYDFERDTYLSGVLIHTAVREDNEYVRFTSPVIYGGPRVPSQRQD